MERYTLSEDQRNLIAQRVKAAKSAHDLAYDIPRTSKDSGHFGSVHERNLAIVKGSYWDAMAGDQPVYQTNLTREALQTLHAILSGTKTVLIVRGRQERFEAVSDLVRGLVNHFWNTLKCDAICERSLRDAETHRFGVVEIGWRFEDEKTIMLGERPGETELADQAALELPEDTLPTLPTVPQTFAPLSAALEQLFPDQTPGESSLSSPDAFSMPQGGASTPPPGVVQPLQTPSEAPPYPMPKGVEYDDPFIERFSPQDFFVDPACTTWRLTDAKYVYRRKGEIVATVKKNSKYRNTKEIKGTSLPVYLARRGTDSGSLGVRADDSTSDDIMVTELCDCYMYLARKTGKEELVHIVWSQELDQALLCEETPYPHFHRTCNPFPFRVMPFEVVDEDTFYGVTSGVEAVIDIQRAYDQSATQIDYQRGHSPNVLLAPSELAGTPEGGRLKSALEAGVENSVVFIQSALIPSVRWMDREPAHADAYTTKAQAWADMLAVLGISEYQTSGVPAKKMTKAEVLTASAQGMTRQDKKGDVYHEFLGDCATCMLILYQQFIDRTREFADMDKTGKVRFGMISLSQLRNGQAPQQQDGGQGQLDRALTDFQDLLEPGIQFAVSVDPAKKRPPDLYQDRQDMVDLLRVIGELLLQPDPLRPGTTIGDARGLAQSIVATYELPNGDEIVHDAPMGVEQQSIQHLTGIIQKLGAMLQATQGAGAPPGNPPGAPPTAGGNPGGLVPGGM
jgi:hypothetical protein